MNARTPVAHAASSPRAEGAGAVTALCILLLAEAAFALAVTILLSLLAGEQRRTIGGDEGIAAENATRFAAGGAILFAIAAYVALRGARRRRSWSWTLSAVLQLVLAVTAGIAMISAGASGAIPGYLIAFGLAAAIMLLLSTSQVRRALGQA
ncbi:MAG: hypothetical protein LC744_01740 [Chloroflexi bacterium]|nr:hypothetical protein [Chloroflexota bacterium]